MASQASRRKLLVRSSSELKTKWKKCKKKDLRKLSQILSNIFYFLHFSLFQWQLLRSSTFLHRGSQGCGDVQPCITYGKEEKKKKKLKKNIKKTSKMVENDWKNLGESLCPEGRRGLRAALAQCPAQRVRELRALERQKHLKSLFSSTKFHLKQRKFKIFNYIIYNVSLYSYLTLYHSLAFLISFRNL